jgi:hypothetical protein
MSIRTFIFCDICNPQALRSIEFRRTTRLDTRPGRRISDGRSWIEVTLEQAVEQEGWLLDEDGLHVCPACQRVRKGVDN